MYRLKKKKEKEKKKKEKKKKKKKKKRRRVARGNTKTNPTKRKQEMEKDGMDELTETKRKKDYCTGGCVGGREREEKAAQPTSLTCQRRCRAAHKNHAPSTQPFIHPC